MTKCNINKLLPRKVIKFTDNGRLNPGVFRVRESNISLTFTSGQPAGMEITMGFFIGAGGTVKMCCNSTSARIVVHKLDHHCQQTDHRKKIKEFI